MAGGPDGVACRLEITGAHGDHDCVAVDADVAISTDLDNLEQLERELLCITVPGRDAQHALLGEHPAHAVGLAQRSAGAGEQVADGGDSAVAIVREDVDHHGHAMRTVALVADLLELLTCQLAGAPFDRVLDLVGWHVDLSRLLHGEA